MTHAVNKAPGKMSNSSYANPGRARIIMGATPFLKKNSIFLQKSAQ